MYTYKKLILLLWMMGSVFISANLSAQANAEEHIIAVTGEVANSLQLKSADLAAMKHVEVKAKDNDGKTHLYAGVPLVDILQQAGVTLGKNLRGENLAKFVLIKAADGYEVVFSLPEIDPEFTSRNIILADKADGKSLAAGTGPYRLIVPDDKKHARWVREVAAIQVHFAKE